MPASPRSVGELFHRPFAKLDADDVRQIVNESSGETGSLVLEFKAVLRGDLVAKACAAFANTIGGLLLVGVTDAGEVVGVIDPPGEPAVWVKDVLRSQVSPLPPFLARAILLDDGRAVIAVLVEESSTTPASACPEGGGLCAAAGLERAGAA